jgi:branched-chain amino acid transport system substrate-binding protein
MSSIYTDNSGPGSVAAAQMAVADFGGTVLGKKIEVLSADNLNKADVGASVTREWIDRDGVDAIVDVPNSAVAFAVQEITRAKNKVFLATGTASSRLTADICSPTTVHWTYDTYALANGTGRRLLRPEETLGSSSPLISLSVLLSRRIPRRSSRAVAAACSAACGTDQLARLRVPSLQPRPRRRRSSALQPPAAT